MTQNNTTAYIGFFAEINTESTQNFLGIIANKLPKGTKTLYIMFDTVGGNVSEGFVLYNILRGLPYKVIMHNVGSVDSIGVIIFLAANERYANENATFLIHPVKSSTKNENATEGYLKEKLNNIQSEQKKILKVLRERCKIPEKDIDTFLQAGQLKDSQYALETGIINEIREISIPADATMLIVKVRETED